jgi:hypothetical protein
MDYLCLLDESESDAGAPDRFFVFGAVLIPLAKVGTLHDGIVQIRTAAGIPDDAPFKWNMPRIPGVSQSDLDDAKRKVPALLTACDGELFVSPVLREIAVKKKRVGDAHLFGANTIFSSVGKTLEERDKRALFLLDRLPLHPDKAFDFLGEKMTLGLGKPSATPKLNRTVGFGFVGAGSTRLGSALDIPLALFTKCLNDPKGAPWLASGRAVCARLAKNSAGRVSERGIMVRPTKVLKQYLPAYQRMWVRLRALGVPP